MDRFIPPNYFSLGRRNQVPPPSHDPPVLHKPEKPSSPELHTILTDLNDQSESPFFRAQNGIPREIRDHIYSFAFTDDLDLTKPYDDDTHYTRPDHTHKRKTSIALLLTCKRIYKEAYSFPLKMKTHTFFFQDLDRAPPSTINYPVDYFSNLPPTQLELLQSFHFFVQQKWLEGEFLALCKQDVMKHLVDLKITLRRSDWWWWERDTPLAITHYKAFPGGRMNPNDAKVMNEMWAEEEQNPSLKREFDPQYWGSGFQHLPKLKTLTMEFETEKSCEAQIDDVAKHAATGWRFPMGDGKVLSTEGNKVLKYEWEGPPCMRSSHRVRHMPLHLNHGNHLNHVNALQMIPVNPVREVQAAPQPPVADAKPILVVRIVKWKLVRT